MNRIAAAASCAIAGALLCPGIRGDRTGERETSLRTGAAPAQEAGGADEPFEDAASGYERPSELPPKRAREASRLEGEVRELREAGRYDEALLRARKLLRIRERYQPRWTTPQGPEEWWQTTDARLLVETLEIAAGLSEEDAAQLAGADRSDVVVALMMAENRLQEARDELAGQLEIRKRLLGPANQGVASCLHSLAGVHSRLLDHPKALSTYREAVELERTILGGVHPQLAESCFGLAHVFHPEMGSAEKTALCREAWQIRCGLFGERDASTIPYMEHYGYSLVECGNSRPGMSVLVEASALRRELFGPDSPPLVDNLRYLGIASQRLEDLQRAEEFYREALEIISANPSLQIGYLEASLEHTLGTLYRQRDEADGAAACFRRGIEVEAGSEFGRSLWSGHCHSGLGSVLNDECDYLGAEACFQEAVAVWRESIGVHLHTGECLEALATVLLVMGDYVESELQHREAMEIWNSYGRIWPLRLSRTLDGLGDLMLARGNAPGAREQYLQSLEIRHELLGSWHPDVASSNVRLARALVALGNTDEAESRGQRALEMLGGAAGPRNAPMAMAKLAQGEIREARGEPVSAEARFREALSIQRELHEAPHPAIASALCSLARARYVRGDFGRAEEGFREALVMQRELFGGVHPDIARSLDGLAGALYGLGRMEEAEEALSEALGMMDLLRPQVLGEEVARARYADRLGLPACAADYVRLMVDRGRWRHALEAFERGRARAILDLLARGEADVVENALRSADPETRARLEKALAAEEEARGKILAAESRIAEAHDRSDLEGPEKSRRIVEAVEALKEARREEGRAFAGVMEELWTLYPQGSPARASRIRNLLRQDELLLGYAWTGEMLLLLVVPPGSGGGSVSGHVLAEGREAMARLAGLAGRVRASMTDAAAAQATRGSRGERLERGKALDRGAIDASAELFRALIPDEVWEEVRSKGRVLLLPDGPLNAIPFEALVVEAGPNWQVSRVLLDVGPEVVYGASASVLIDRAEARRGQLVRGPGRISALVVADPEFRPKRSVRRTSGGDAEEQGPGARKAEEGADRSRSLFEELPDLPGTRAEGTRIVQAFRRVGERKVLLIRDREATQSRLLEELPGRRFLHLATHGLTGSASRPFDACLALSPPDRLTPGDVGFLRLEDLVRSWRGRLKSCELVVLSACETASGEQIGDSYMALPIGFFYAGAPAVIASLWKVDDKCTADLMGSFYERILDDRQGDKLTLFTETRKAFRKEQVHPFYWAPFVYLGDPR